MCSDNIGRLLVNAVVKNFCRYTFFRCGWDKLYTWFFYGNLPTYNGSVVSTKVLTYRFVRKFQILCLLRVLIETGNHTYSLSTVSIMPLVLLYCFT